MESVSKFFSQTMKIGKLILIIAVRRTGSAKPRSVIVTLKNVRDKGLIFQNVKNLKTVWNSNDESYFINDHLTLERQENQCKQKLIMRYNKKLPVGDPS